MDKTELEQKGAGQDGMNEEPFAPEAAQEGRSGAAETGLEGRLKAESEKARHYHDQWVRTTADLENYKKRAARERQDAIRFANAALLEKLIPALDHFDMALTAANNTEG